MCAEWNGLIESSPGFATHARAYGWKLSPWESPEDTPFYDVGAGKWYLLDNLYNRTITERKAA
jgi:hypothetical protein